MSPTCEQVDNARMLAATLDKVAAEWPEHFRMGSWVGDYSGDKRRHLSGEHPADCGTTGCALGWTPYATGIPMTHTGGIFGGWQHYAAEVLGIDLADQFDWFDYIFLNLYPPTTGAPAAKAAAGRLREWIDAHEGDCREQESLP